jgi:glycosyltransferase involved in cell wall biosynthesis
VRLLVVTQYFWPEDFRINELVSELARRGHDVTVLTGKPNYPDGEVFPAFAADPARFASYKGVSVHRVPMRPRRRGALNLLLNYLSFAISATAYGIVALRRERFDATFVFEPSPVTVGLPAVTLRRLRGWPVAFWVLDQWPETLAAVGMIRSPRLLAWVGRITSFIYRRCDIVMTQSRGLVDVAKKYAGPRTRLLYFPNWAEGDYVGAETTPAAEVPDAPGRFSVMFAGNIGESQDFPAVLAAAEALKTDDRIRWLIVGDGRAAPWVRDEIARRGLADRFIMLGRFPQNRMPSFFRRADCLLVSLKADPVFSMTIPGKIQSYLAFGAPIIGMLDGEGAKVIVDAQAGLTCPAGDAAGLARIVSRMADLSPEDRRAMGERGAAYARLEFARDVLMNRLEAALESIRSGVAA